jgi:hypothetical protein
MATSGCGGVWLDPYIDSPPRKFEDSYNDTKLPNLFSAAKDAEEQRLETANFRSDLSTSQAFLRYGAFGAAAAGGIAATYGAHRDLILGLGLGATATYAAGSLFASKDRIGVYRAGADTLGCIVGTADSVLATDKTIEKLTGDAGPVTRQKDSLEGYLRDSSIRWEDTDKQNAMTAISKAEAMRTNIASFRAQDASFASAIRQSSRTTVETVNIRTENLQGDISEVIKQARNIGVAGLSYADMVSSPDSSRNKQAANRTDPTAAQTYRLRAMTAGLNSAIDKVSKLIKEATNGIDEVATLCVLREAVVIENLGVSPNNLAIARDQTATLSISGGRGPFTVGWKGTHPASNEAEFNHHLNGRQVLVVGKSALTSSSGPFKLEISDSRAAEETVVVTITTQ